MKFVLGFIIGGVVAFGAALWYQGEPPFAGASPTGKGPDMVLSLSDRYLSREVASEVASRSHGVVSGIHVRSSPGDAVFVEGSASAADASIPVGASLALQVRGGQIGLRIRSTHLGPIPVPSVVTSPVAEVINRRLSLFTSGLSYRITGAGTTGRAIQIYLKQR